MHMWLMPIGIVFRLSLFVHITGLLMLRAFLPWWWARRGLRAALLPYLCLQAILFTVWRYADFYPAWYAMVLCVLSLAVVGPAVATLPMASWLRMLAVAGPTSPARREALSVAAAALPTSVMAVSARGVKTSLGAPRIPRVPMRYKSLPRSLDGLKILHLSDLHLGLGRDLRDLEAALTRAQDLSPDLIVVTGDLTEDLGLIVPSLNMIAQMRPRFGVRTIFGNHEHHPGIRQVHRLFDRSATELLVDRASRVHEDLVILGVDDPLQSVGNRDYYDRAVGRSLEGTPKDAFKLLLCHRPDGFNASADLGVDLTLSGHTHGGQLALYGHNILDFTGTPPYPWGCYEHRDSRLYTSAGFGDWMPYRQGVPTEMPLIELVRG